MALPSKKKACTQRDHVFQGTAELDSSSGDGGNQKVALFLALKKKTLWKMACLWMRKYEKWRCLLPVR
jgi:hypothetical protein